MPAFTYTHTHKLPKGYKTVSGAFIDFAIRRTIENMYGHVVAFFVSDNSIIASTNDVNSFIVVNIN